MHAIEINKLKKYFGHIRAVDDISFEIPAGQIFGFLGPNGAGKTTTIRCMLNMIHPTSGAISILGMDSQAESVALKSKLGYLPGEIHLHDNWSGQDHIDFVRKLKRLPDNLDRIISDLNFDPSIKTRYLSLGNRQKLGLILALMGDPEVLLLDEPVLGLDPLHQNLVFEMINKANSRGATVFMSSHNLNDVEIMCNRVGIIKAGKIVAVEEIQKLKQKQIYKVAVRFRGPIPKGIFEDNNISVTRESSDWLEMDVRSDINQLIEKLSQCEVTDLKINHASLKSIFMEYYE
jgi:ABC-2 type transport system ATP-binding protein